MQNSYWNVLIVDDDEDIRRVTQLALKRMRVYGLPVHLHMATSKASAIEWLDTNPEAGQVHAAIIDVVMEHDTAGLELCEHIRNRPDGGLIPIILRTGQAGKAPERDVVDRFDILAYLAKSEATDDKLYSLVKCCVKECSGTFVLRRLVRMLRFIGPRLTSREAFKTRLAELQAGITSTPSRSMFSVCHFWGDDDDHVGTGIFADRKQALEIRDRLLAAPKQLIGDGGDWMAHAMDPAGMSLQHPRGTALSVLAPVPGILPKQHHLWLTNTWPPAQYELEARHAHSLAFRTLYALAAKSG